MKKEYKYPRIDDMAYRKAYSQARRATYYVMSAFDKYEHKQYIDGAVVNLMDIMEKFAMRVRGKDEIIKIDPNQYRFGPLERL